MLIRSITAVAGVFLGLLTLASAAERGAGPPLERRVSDVALPVDAETLNRQYVALSSMPSVRVVYSTLGPVRSVEGETGIVLSRQTRNLKRGQDASEVLQKFKDVLLATGSETLNVRWNHMEATGRRLIRMDQIINGIPVLYGSVSVQIEEATGLVEELGANFLPDRGLPRQPKLSEADAAKRVAQHLVERRGAKPGSAEMSTFTLGYHGTHPGSTRGRLVWAVRARYLPASDGHFEDGIFLIDAIDGDYVGSDAASREVSLKGYTAKNAAPDPGKFPDGLTLLFTHPGSSPDQSAMNAYNSLLDSIDAIQIVGLYTPPSPLGLIVHYDSNWMNARYDRTKSIDYFRFGDGVPGYTGPLGNSRDAVAHEFGHSVANALFAPFGGDVQSAAIDEAFGDVTAAIVDVYKRRGVASATWTIAEIYTNDPTRGLRSMLNPKSMDPLSRDWFPARLEGPADKTRHYNSTIMSHAFKLLVTGGFHARQGQLIADSNVPGTIPSLFVPALGPDKTWQIFFRTFRAASLDIFLTS